MKGRLQNQNYCVKLSMGLRALDKVILDLGALMCFRLFCIILV